MVGIRHRPSPSGEAGLQWEPVVLVSWFLWLCCGPLVAHLVETLATTLSRALSRALLGGGFGCDGTQWKDLPAFFSAACSDFLKLLTFLKLRIVNLRVAVMAQQLMNLTSIHEDADSKTRERLFDLDPGL
ncbi:uncharacterized protein LOC102157627 [Sus scrofa]|uniref:uncharacterized protein LOC102157627 n=1 Tax=Sus scrofa TaxID=9823 RepID=UPI000A2B0999|nr:uncharacterized protein LOC102157627 [Sus scrofa]